METSEEGKPHHNIGESPGYILWQSAMHWQRSVNQVLAVFDLTYTQFIVLAIAGGLKEEQQEVYQFKIARYARIDRMMTSRVIASLERKGFIKRLKKNGDARANLVQLTSKGEEIMKKALKTVGNLEGKFFKDEKTAGYFLQD